MLDFMMRAKIPIQILPICFWLPSGYDYVHLTALHGLEEREGSIVEGDDRDSREKFEGVMHGSGILFTTLFTRWR